LFVFFFHASVIFDATEDDPVPIFLLEDFILEKRQPDGMAGCKLLMIDFL
jgi:hypothetical protein